MLIEVIPIEARHGGEFVAGVFPSCSFHKQVFCLLIHFITRLIKPRLDGRDCLVQDFKIDPVVVSAGWDTSIVHV